MNANDRTFIRSVAYRCTFALLVVACGMSLYRLYRESDLAADRRKRFDAAQAEALASRARMEKALELLLQRQ